MTTAPTMEEHIKLSGLEVTPSSSSSSSPSPSSLLQWNTANQWSPLLGGARQWQACVLVNGNHGMNASDEDVTSESIVVLGGDIEQDGDITNSVIVWDPSTQQWRNGPNMTEKRLGFAAVVCQDKIYAIGGMNGDFQRLDTIEWIQVSSLLEQETERSNSRQSNSQWTMLPCQLSSPREGCSAVVVHNHYIVIMGGVETVDILDTAPYNDNNNNGEPTIIAGPAMNAPRYSFGAAVVDNRIFVVGGEVDGCSSSSVESLLFHNMENKNTTATSINSNTINSIFPSSLSWMKEHHLTLSQGCYNHDVVKLGSCLIVAGGNFRNDDLFLVEVLDVQQGIVWNLPNLTVPRYWGCSMVALSDCLFLLGGDCNDDRVLLLNLSIYRKHQQCYKLVSFLIAMEFFSQQRQ